MPLSYTVISDLEKKHRSPNIVGMAVYSGDRLDWVKLSVESILTQSAKDFMLILVIDGDIPKAIHDYLESLDAQHDNFVVIKNKLNQGLSVSMNLIIDLFVTSSSEYFFRMDADDVAFKGRLERQKLFLDANPNVQVLGTALNEISETGKKVGSRKLPIAHHEIVRIMPRRCAINHPTAAVRASVFLEGFRYRASLKNTQDYFLWAELCAAGYRFANLPEALLDFRRVNDFYKRRGLSKSINEFKARFYTMKILKRYSLGNVVYAFAVLFLRLMPAKIVKLAYKLDRYLLNKRVRHE